MHSLHSSADPTARDVSMNEAFSKYVVLLIAICALQQYAASFSHTHTHTHSAGETISLQVSSHGMYCTTASPFKIQIWWSKIYFQKFRYYRVPVRNKRWWNRVIVSAWPHEPSLKITQVQPIRNLRLNLVKVTWRMEVVYIALSLILCI